MTQPVDPSTADRLAADDAQRRKLHGTAKREARAEVGGEAAFHLANQALNLPNRVYATAVNPVVGGPVSAVSSAMEVVADHIGYRHLRGGETGSKEKDLAAQASLAAIANTLMLTMERAGRLAGARPGDERVTPYRPDPHDAARRQGREQEAARQAAEAVGPEHRVHVAGQLLSVPAHVVTAMANPMTAPIGIAIRASSQAASDHVGYERKRGQAERSALGDLENHAAADIIAAETARLTATVRDLGGRPQPAIAAPEARQAPPPHRPSPRHRITSLITRQLTEFPARATGAVFAVATAGVAAGLESAATSGGLAAVQLAGDVLDDHRGAKRDGRVAAGDLAVANRVADLAGRVAAARGELDQVAARRPAPAPRPPVPPPARGRAHTV